MTTPLRSFLLILVILPLPAQSRVGLEIGNASALGDLRDSLGKVGSDDVGGTLGVTFRLHTFQRREPHRGTPGDLSLRLRASLVAYPDHAKPSPAINVSG